MRIDVVETPCVVAMWVRERTHTTIRRIRKSSGVSESESNNNDGNGSG